MSEVERICINCAHGEADSCPAGTLLCWLDIGAFPVREPVSKKFGDTCDDWTLETDDEVSPQTVSARGA